MKTETQIAKELIRFRRNYGNKFLLAHKETLQRFLEFFGSLHFGGYVPSRKRKITQKEDDLKQAIKIYDDAGI